MKNSSISIAIFLSFSNYTNTKISYVPHICTYFRNNSKWCGTPLKKVSINVNKIKHINYKPLVSLKDQITQCVSSFNEVFKNKAFAPNIIWRLFHYQKQNNSIEINEIFFYDAISRLILFLYAFEQKFKKKCISIYYPTTALNID